MIRSGVRVPLPAPFAGIAQLVEQLTLNQEVGGGQTPLPAPRRYIEERQSRRAGAVCKTVAFELSGFDSHPLYQYGGVDPSRCGEQS